MDWSACNLVEVVPGKSSGRPLVRGTRVPADAILSNFLSGSPVQEIQENYPSVSLETIESLMEYAHARQLQRAS